MSNNNGVGMHGNSSYGRPRMPVYDGTEDVHLFLEKLEVYFHFTNTADDAQKADVLVLQCGGEAGQHILSVKKANIHATYDSLKQSLLTRYGGQTHTWQNKLMTLRQSLGQPVASYAGQFRNHLLRAGLAGNDPMAVNLFIAGLVHAHCKYQVRQQSPPTIDEAVQHAEVWEDAFRGMIPLAPSQMWVDGTIPYSAATPSFSAQMIPTQQQYPPSYMGATYMQPTSVPMAVQRPRSPPIHQVVSPVYNVNSDLDGPLTSAWMKDALHSIESRLNEKLIQHVQTVVNEVAPLQQQKPPTRSNQQQNQQAANQPSQQSQGGANSQQHIVNQQISGNMQGGGWNNQQTPFNSNGNSNGGGGKQQNRLKQQYPNHGNNVQWSGNGGQLPYPQYPQQFMPPLPQYPQFNTSLSPPPFQYPMAGPALYNYSQSYMPSTSQDINYAPCQLCQQLDHQAIVCPKRYQQPMRSNSAPSLPQQPPPPVQQPALQSQPPASAIANTRQTGTVTSITHAVITEEVRNTSVYAAVDPTHVGSTPLYCPASVHDIRTEDAVVDSGSGVTLISGKLFGKLPAEIQSNIRPPRHSIQVKAANETPMVMKGEIVLDVLLGGTLALQRTPILVVDGLAADIIVGNDQLEHFEHVSTKYNHIQYVHPKTGELACLPLRPRKRPLQSFSVFLTRTTKIQPRSEFVGRVGTVDGMDRESVSELAAKEGSEVCCLVESVADSPADMQLATSVVSLDTVVTPRRIPVSIKNTGGSKLVVRKGTRIAVLSLLTPECVLAVWGGAEPPSHVQSVNAVELLNSSTLSHSAVSASSTTESANPLDQIDMSKCKLDQSDRDKLDTLLRSYADCFAINPKSPSTTTVAQHTINTGDAKPIKLPPYRVAHQHEEFIRAEIEQLLKNGQIRKSASPWSFPVVVVLKKDGSLRFCIDYRKLNAVTKKDGYPVPNVGELLDCLHGSTVYSTLDLASGYWQVTVAEEDREKTAFVTKYGLNEWNNMPFGLANAPATFVRLMEKVLSDLLYKFVIAYFDDITVYSKSVDEHLCDGAW